MEQQTLEQQGNGWAELYRGSGRPTGRLAENPVYMQDGDVAPDWTWVGSMTEDQFNNWFEREQHGYCHSASHADSGCELCDEAGYNTPDSDDDTPLSEDLHDYSWLDSIEYDDAFIGAETIAKLRRGALDFLKDEEL